MALLNLRGTKKASAKPVEKKLAVTESPKVSTHASAQPFVLKRPHITEKASASAEKGVYVFEVTTSANKRDIAAAVRAMYKVTPVKVTVVNKPQKRIIVKGRLGVRPAGKKAYVFLKKGEKIEVV